MCCMQHPQHLSQQSASQAIARCIAWTGKEEGGQAAAAHSVMQGVTESISSLKGC